MKQAFPVYWQSSSCSQENQLWGFGIYSCLMPAWWCLLFSWKTNETNPRPASTCLQCACGKLLCPELEKFGVGFLLFFYLLFLLSWPHGVITSCKWWELQSKRGIAILCLLLKITTKTSRDGDIANQFYDRTLFRSFEWWNDGRGSSLNSVKYCHPVQLILCFAVPGLITKSLSRSFYVKLFFFKLRINPIE